jgi:hypothetical protein
MAGAVQPVFYFCPRCLVPAFDGWVESKSIRFFLPASADEFVGGKAAESLESFGEVIGSDEVAEMNAQLVMAVVV